MRRQRGRQPARRPHEVAAQQQTGEEAGVMPAAHTCLRCAGMAPACLHLAMHHDS